MAKFNTIVYDTNKRKFVTYDVIPYFKRVMEGYTFNSREELKEFIIRKSKYMFWARCEYEIILVDWPCQKTSTKIDVHHQIMNNIDVVLNILCE